MSPPVRFCSSCGAPAGGGTHCGRCGVVFAGALAPGVPAPAGEVRGSVPSWLIGLVACMGGGLLFAFCGGLLAAILVPSMVKRESRAKVSTAATNLTALWAAELSWAAAHDGEFLEFHVDHHDESDPNFRRLGAYDDGDVFVISAIGNVDPDDSEDEHHAYSADVTGSTLILRATANLDGDAFLDEWALSSADGIARQLKDDSLNLDLGALSEELTKREPRR